jgi:hypothetical protein
MVGEVIAATFLSTSSYADRFILKGASLFLVWKGQNYRVTKDADLLAFEQAL